MKTKIFCTRKLLLILLFCHFTNNLFSQCSDFQIALGSSGYERAIDIAPTLNNEFYVAGMTRSFGNSEDILITKLKIDGTVLWSKTFGAVNNESVRKIAPTSDGGLLVVGQTNSFSNSSGDILAFKISSDGTALWYRKFGLGSASGDLGMDAIETSDGGYAISGIINVNGLVADQIVIKLNSAANIVWTKRFDRGDGEDGVGIVEKGDTLIVASDLQNNSSHYQMQVMKLKMSDGNFIMSKKLAPALRGLFNPYLYKNPSGNGYYISGHTIDITSYANMKHTVLSLDDDLNIVNTQLINVAPVTNDFFTGFYPLSDGSFISCASNQVNSDGYFFRVRSDNTISYSKRINKLSDVRLYRLSVMGQNVIAVGGLVRNGQEDFFITSFPISGQTSASCDVEQVNTTIERPVYTSGSFTWPTVSAPTFSNTAVSISSSTVSLQKVSLCSTSLAPDFTYDQDVCSPKTINFKTNLANIKSYKWDFGSGQLSQSIANPSNTFPDFGTYMVKLVVESTGGCMDSVSKAVAISISQSDLVFNSDTSICVGDSVLLKGSDAGIGFCWQANNNTIGATAPNIFVKPVSVTTYSYTSKVLGNNLVVNSNFNGGNTGFLSDYVNSNSGLSDGVYSVRPDITSWHPGMASCKDHTNGAESMMLVNGSQQQNAKVWSQTIAVSPNSNYIFSVWLQSLTTNNPAELQLSINGKLVGSVFKANSQTCIWNQYNASWSSGTSTTATISIINMNRNFTGNDFALDDIFFGEYFMKTDQVTVQVLSQPAIDLGENISICHDSLVQLNSNISAGTSITWTPNLYLSNPAIANPTARPVSSITYIATASNNAGCSKKDTLTIMVVPKPSLALMADTSVCLGESVRLNSQSSGATTFNWQPVNGLSDASMANPVATPTTSTDYVLIASNDGCSETDTVLINVKPLPDITLSNDTTVCEGAQIQLLVSGGITYEWNPATGLSAVNIPDPLARPLVSTTYKVEVEGVNGCTGNDSVHVSVIPKPVFSISPVNPSVCSGDTLLLKASGGDVYEWSPAMSVLSPDSSVTQVIPTITTRYKVLAKSTVCNVEDSLFTTVVVNQLPVLSVQKSNDIDCSHLEAQLKASGGNIFRWSPTDGLSDPTVFNPIASPSQSTTYTVRLTSLEGCSSTDSVTVKVEAVGDHKLYVPTAFTPNNDGNNDCFRLKQWGALKEFSLSIFNRWGEKVFSSSNPDDCWDGTYKGYKQPTGVFVYIIKGKSLCGAFQKKGTITLIR